MIVGNGRMAFAFLMAICVAACGSGDEDALMGRGANSLTPEQVEAALGPDIANEAGEPGNASEDQALEKSEAVQAADAAEPVPAVRQDRTARPGPSAETEQAPRETLAPVDNNSSE